MKYKIAFLFLTIDDINFPQIWECYFRNVDKELYSIYFHPKHPEKVSNEWLKKYQISNLTETGWGFITHAYYNLMEEAYKDKLNMKFITISESCIPLRTFKSLYKQLLIKDDIRTSYIKFMNITNYDLNERIKTNQGWEKYKFVKHYARFSLSRYHVEILMKHKDDFIFFNSMHVGDEFFLSLLQPFDYVEDREITYDNWEYVRELRKEYNNKIGYLYKKMETNEMTTKNKEQIKKEIHELKKERDDISKNPKSYYEITKCDIQDVKKHKESFFWRKFPKTSDIMKYYDIDRLCGKK